MARALSKGEKPLDWVGSSKRISSPFPRRKYRAIYVVRFEEVVYVLHAFQKKSPRGVKTAQIDVELVRRRLKIAQQDYEVRYGKTKS